MSVINTNVNSLIAQNSLTVNGRSLAKAMEQLSTGKRINSAADDAAGLAISQVMTSDIRGLNQAVRNANDGISLLQVAEGALNAVSDMLQRMRELAVQSANDTNSSIQQGFLDEEYQLLGEEIDRVLGATTWNGISVFSGSGGRSADGTFNFQVGAGTASSLYNISITISGATSVGALMSASLGSIGSAAAALSAMDNLDTAIENVSTLRSTLGATINRLTYAADNATNISINMQASRSRILDADYASATTELARTQIIQQAATAMLAQANQAPATVLSLLK
ncbi:MAG: Flagellin [Pseudomonadota bacterium]|jgi:flagellin